MSNIKALLSWIEKNGSYNNTHTFGICLTCNKRFSFSPSAKRKFCSHNCYQKSMIGKRDEQTSRWKGDNIGYASLHQWVAKKLGKPSKCEFCGKEEPNGRKIHWANKSHEYKRNLEDWIRLCKSCHVRYDSGENRGAMKQIYV